MKPRQPLTAGCARCRGTGFVCESHTRHAFGRGPGHCDASGAGGKVLA